MVRNALKFINISRKLRSTKIVGLHETSVVEFPFREFHRFQVHPVVQNTMQRQTSKDDHLTVCRNMRTAASIRDNEIHAMLVKEIKALSPTIKEVTLEAERKPTSLTFKAGQWVDVFIPGVETVGGFSMCSSPHEMAHCYQLRLAIKYSNHPPAHWMHECQVGDKLNVRIGGDFYLDLTAEPGDKRVLLIAGGVGINPLCSMVHYARNENKIRNGSGSETRLCLLYSAKAKNELIFKEVLDNYRDSSHFSVKYFITGNNTKQTTTIESESETNIQNRRIRASDLKTAVNWLIESPKSSLNTDHVVAYICGPLSMITELTDQLSALKIRKVNFEKWW